MQPTTLTLDSRESNLKLELESLNFTFETKQLDVGDIIISKSGDHFFFERKTWSDLYSSIVSTRFREQRERLKMSIKENNARVFYIVEGTNTLEPTKSKTAKGALENLCLFHNIPVLYTIDTRDTAKKIVDWYNKINKNKKDNCNSPVALKTVKKSGNISNNMFFHQLNFISGVSPKIAIEIIKYYPTVSSLIKTYNTLTIENSQLLLGDITIGKRKLGKILSRRIYNVYCE